MERLTTYILDSNAVSDYLNQNPLMRFRVDNALALDHVVYLAQPVHYEVARGLLKVGAKRKLSFFENEFVPELDWLTLTDSDWRRATNLWAEMTQKGKQLSDVDYLIAVLSIRLNAVIITADNDFDALPVKRENWRV